MDGRVRGVELRELARWGDASERARVAADADLPVAALPALLCDADEGVRAVAGVAVNGARAAEFDGLLVEHGLDASVLRGAPVGVWSWVPWRLAG